MTWPRRLIFVRHAESEGNTKSVEERALYDVSSHDYALTPKGEAQARITGQWIEDRFGIPTYKFVSYYKRSRETMRLMFPYPGRVFEDARLAEAQRGIYHAMTKEAIAARFPEEQARKQREGLYHYRAWGGENWPDVEMRIHSFLDMLRRDFDNDHVVVVGHGFWHLLLHKILHHIPAEEALKSYLDGGTVENASVTVYSRTQGGGFYTEVDTHVPWEGRL